MRVPVLIACLLVMTALAAPAAGQLRQDAARATAPVRLYDTGGTGFSLNQYFSPEHFRMSHSFEMSAGSFGGHSSSLAMYTNSMMWKFSNKLDGRVDIAMAYSPMNNMPGMSASGDNNARVFLRNAELAYRPSENTLLHLSVRQSPFGNYMSPYGRGYGLMDDYAAGSRRDPFWNDQRW